MKIQSNMYINNPDMTSRNIEKKENSSHALVQEDDIQISDSARKLVETARNKVSDFHTMHFSSINGEIREIPAEYKCENLFKLDLKATSISGEQSAFEGCSENQSEVFEKWLDENASEYLTEDEMKDLKEKINAMTADVDFLNAQEGYRGTSYESVFLLSASEAGLRKVNEMYVPEQLQAGFSDMIDEYVHFNDSARNSIMEKMTPDYMVVGIGSKDDIQISDSARKLVETARNKVSDFHTMHFSSINGEIREIPAEYKCENLFKLDLKATSISGEQSAFEGCSENQSEVFEKWLDENASEYLTEDEMKDLKEKINAMTADVDFLNAQEGYRGTSYESVFLLSASEAGLRKVNEMYVPEQLQAGFSDMIDEYVHFNDSARNSIMEKMTPDYMVVGIGSKTESYKYKSEIISDETAFYANEKNEISGICNQFLNGKTDQKLFCNEMKDRLNDYYGSRYELRNQPEAVESRVNNMLSKLQHMYAL